MSKYYRSSYSKINMNTPPTRNRDFSRIYYADKNESPEGVTMRATVNGEGAATFSKSAAEECLDWIYSCQDEIEKSGYGGNREAVEEALRREEARGEQIEQFSQRMERSLHNASSKEQEKVKAAYEKLKGVSEKKVNCLKTMRDVATLQELCVSLSKKIDLRAVDLVNLGEKDVKQFGDNLFGFIAPSSQDCVFATRDNWNWNLKLSKCIELHMRNASDYHQFFHEVEESSVWLMEDLTRIHKSHQMSPLTGDYTHAKRLLDEIQDITTALRQWQTKTDQLWEKGQKVLPVYKRTIAVTEPTPARAIADYSTPEFAVRDEEDLLLLDNTDEQLWTVRNARGKEGRVPPLAVVIPGPTKEALEAAVRMRLQLLAAWTNALKTIGKRLIVLMLLVFKPHYDDAQLRTMKAIGMMDRQDLLRILDYIESTLKAHWADHEGFQNLQERILMLRMILEQADDSVLQDPETYRALIVQISTLESLMKQYQDMWKEWEKFKVALETSRAPELMLICDKWEQLKFVTRQSFASLGFWQNELPFTEEEKTMIGLQGLANGFGAIDEIDSEQLEGSIVETTALQTAAVMNGDMAMGGALEGVEEGVFGDSVCESAEGFQQARISGVSESGEFGYATETKTAQTEQLSSVEGEESQRFVIRSVKDSRTNSEISLDDAIIQGIIRPDEGNYCDLKTGDVIPIPVAMSAGLINVVFTTTKRAKEKKSSVGIITVKTIRTPVRPYKVISVKDTKQGTSLSREEAITRGVIHPQLGVYKDTGTGKEMLISDAAGKGFVQIEYEGPAPEPEVESCAYAVRAVVDRRSKKTITFQEAVSRGIIDKESGAYHDNSTGQTMYIADAIMRGYLKARILDDPATMEIDPENKMTVDKTEKIKKKVMNPLSVINALKDNVGGATVNGE